MKQYEPIRDLALSQYAVECDNSFSSPHFHQCLEMIYVLRGQMKISVESDTKYLEKDEIAFIPGLKEHCNEPSELRPTRSIHIVTQLHFCPEFLHAYNGKEVPDFLLDRAFNRTLLDNFKKLVEAVETENKVLLIGHLNVILGNILTHYAYAEEDRPKRLKEDLLMDIIRYINDNFRQPLTLEMLARKFGYSKHYFSKFFNKNLSCTLSEYINSLRVQYVQNELSAHNDASIINTIYNAGLNSVNSYYYYLQKHKNL